MAYEAINYLKNGKVFIMNPNYELSIETIKNFALTGIHNISVKNTPDEEFLFSKSFYLDMTKGNYIEQIKNYVNDLNPSINFNVFDNYESIDSIDTYSLIVVINQEYENIMSDVELKKFRDEKECKMVFGWDNNYSGCVFVDSSNYHCIVQPNDISYDNIKVDKIIDNTIYVTGYGYSENDTITFNGLQGNCRGIHKKILKFLTVSKTFQIDLTEPVEFINGFVQKKHVQTISSHKSIWDQTEEK